MEDLTKYKLYCAGSVLLFLLFIIYLFYSKGNVGGGWVTITLMSLASAIGFGIAAFIKDKEEKEYKRLFQEEVDYLMSFDEIPMPNHSISVTGRTIEDRAYNYLMLDKIPEKYKSKVKSFKEKYRSRENHKYVQSVADRLLPLFDNMPPVKIHIVNEPIFNNEKKVDELHYMNLITDENEGIGYELFIKEYYYTNTLVKDSNFYNVNEDSLIVRILKGYLFIIWKYRWSKKNNYTKTENHNPVEWTDKAKKLFPPKQNNDPLGIDDIELED
ncbi:MAG: hypothetical protein ACR2N3_04800 [Pyrinomonadaceae bacterium]